MRDGARPALPWWVGGSLTISADGVEVGGRNLEELARSLGTPLYLYDGARIREQIAILRAALAPFQRRRIYYALKANRFGPLLKLIRGEGDVGVDACSPREVDCALEAGFRPQEISVTASSLSQRDIAALAKAGVHVNFDYPGAFRSYAARMPKESRVGLRIDPGVRVGYGVNEKTAYGAGKLGLPIEDLDHALAAAAAAGLLVDTLHMHLGWGLRAGDETPLRESLGIMATLARRIPTLDCINVGGGLGGRLRAGDEPLSPESWVNAIRDAFDDSGLTVACEPGTFVVAAAGVLVAQVTAVWEKRGERWIGLDAGQATNVYAAHYGLELEILPIASPLADPVSRYNIAGNINEAGDVFARGRLLPELTEGDFVALLPAGAYGASMASDHCLRGDFAQILL